MNRVDYEVVTAHGVPIKTLSERKSATKYAAEIAETFPGLAVFEVIHQEPIRRRIYTPGGRAKLRLVVAS